MRRALQRWLAVVVLTLAIPAAAQAVAPGSPVAAGEQSGDEPLQQDAASIAGRLGLTDGETERQLRLQEASVAATDAVADEFTERLAGIAVEHAPTLRVVVLLTGDKPEPDRTLVVGSDLVPVVFRTGTRSTRTELIQAIGAYQAAIRASLLVPPSMGVDQRTGELVVMINNRDLEHEGSGPLHDRLAALTHVPVRIRVVDQPSLDMAGVEGGIRLVGSVPDNPHRFFCTAGFVVTDGVRTGLATAAHCPDELSVRDDAGHDETLPFVGQWGWGNQDVQINASPVPLSPAFFGDTARTSSRLAEGARRRAGMRAGEIVCHRGERTGHSCAEVELTDFAPAGDLCGGPCLATWTTVAGPSCKGGDSGSPVFLGTTAYGILKGGSYRADGSCAFYFYMSLDYLPAGWRLLTAADQPPAASIAPPPDGG